MARIVIVDAGPLIALAAIDQLILLRQLFSEITITESVKKECLVKSGEETERIESAISDGWLVVHIVTQHSQPLSPSLGLGESDSIRLAMEQPKDSLLILDDRLARRYALKHGLNIVGTVRLLDLAEQLGLIKSAEHSIQKMAQGGYRISIELLKKIRSG